MDAVELQAVKILKDQADARIQANSARSWDARRTAASELLAAAYEAWWRVHTLDATRYERDLARLNALAGWSAPYAQVAYWRPQTGSAVLMPPKFFGGDPLALEEPFVASMSLNHAILPATSAPFARELAEQQNHPDAFEAHSRYFSRPYAYRRFFKPRGEVLHAYAMKVGAGALPTASDWPALNRRFSFYIEAFPTRSGKFAEPPSSPGRALLDREVFVCAINSIVHDIVLRLLRPSRVLLAGKATWGAWPELGLAEFGKNVGALVRSDGRCPVFRSSAPRAIHGETTTIVRTNFLRTVYGPNSTLELQRLGRDVLGS